MPTAASVPTVMEYTRQRSIEPMSIIDPTRDLQDFRKRLSVLDSCVVSDALDRLKLPGAVLGLHRLATDLKIVGPVITVKLERADGRVGDRHLGTAAIDSAAPGDIIVIEHHSRADCAGWGGLLSYAARARRVAGVIVDGMCRDIDDSRRLDFPVFARGAVPTTARSRIIETAFNTTITVGPVTVTPGDWVIADGSGVVFVSRNDAALVLEEAEKLTAREALMIAEIDKGTPVSQVMSGAYEHMLRKD
jgi:4-hydroxy-4-methyl-2-oxoglutarate aldolase